MFAFDSPGGLARSLARPTEVGVAKGVASLVPGGKKVPHRGISQISLPDIAKKSSKILFILSNGGYLSKKKYTQCQGNSVHW